MKVWLSLTLVALLALYSQWQIHHIGNRVHALSVLPNEVAVRASQSIQSVERTKIEAISALHKIVESSLIPIATRVGDEQAAALENRLKSLQAELDEKNAEIRAASDEKDRLNSGRPEHVDLDKLRDYYGPRLRDAKSDFDFIEGFNTALGRIEFSKRDFSFAVIPSDKNLAWIKIGRSGSTENSALIKAWLDESADAKVRMGYVREFKSTKPSDYGEYTEAVYKKGDMYLKTYYQYQRILESYDRHSLKYTYYVEVGSLSRKKQYELEQYNTKLGS